MLPAYLGDAKFWCLLYEIDRELAEAARVAGCAHCRGVLHRADYPRKPRGVARSVLGTAYERRLSWCCAQEGCRRRTTPASVRFLSRRVYLGALVVLASALSQGLTTKRRRALCDELGVSARTVGRWRRWWRAQFPLTDWWRAERGRFMPPIALESLPGGLLERFAAGVPAPDALAGLLRWLSPVSFTLFEGGR